VKIGPSVDLPGLPASRNPHNSNGLKKRWIRAQLREQSASLQGFIALAVLISCARAALPHGTGTRPYTNLFLLAKTSSGHTQIIFLGYRSVQENSENRVTVA